jgi:ribosome-associated protein
LKGTRKDPSLELALAAADLAADGKALGIVIMDLREVSSVADYFVVASGRSHIQVEAVADRIVEGLRERLDRRPIAVEGLEQSLWAILDYGSVVVHVFQESVREIYDLERLWSLAPRWKHEDGVPAPVRPAAKRSAKTGPTASPRRKIAAGEGA